MRAESVKNTIGFSGVVHSSESLDTDEMLSKVQPQDLLKFGLIPEFIGRVPVVVTLQSLNREILKRILLEPKNSLVKQYKKLFEYDKVELEFQDEALDAITDIALQRKTGARGLRAIVESVLMDVMYNIPSLENVEKCIITSDSVHKKAEPILVYNKDKKALPQGKNSLPKGQRMETVS